MKNKSGWNIVYPDKRERISKYFDVKLYGVVFLRLYAVKGDKFPCRLQLSGDNIGFHSRSITADELSEVLIDFPFIDTYYK